MRERIHLEKVPGHLHTIADLNELAVMMEVSQNIEIRQAKNLDKRWEDRNCHLAAAEAWASAVKMVRSVKIGG